MSIRNPSITYLIASTGRDTLKDTLRSLHGQFAFGLDKIRLYFDGVHDWEPFKEEILMFGDDITPIELKIPLGYWGHGIRNKYQDSCTTDYIHHMDDDDIYVQESIPQVRRVLQDNYGKIVICKFRTIGKRIIWEHEGMAFGQIGTPSGFIFNRPEIFGTWGYEYGGDYNFYTGVQENIGKENIVYSDILVVKTRPKQYGY